MPSPDLLLNPALRELLLPWVRDVLVHTPSGDVRLARVDDALLLSAIPDGHDPAFEVHLSLSLMVKLQGEITDDIRTEIREAFFWPVTQWSLRRRRTRDWILQLGDEIDNVLHITLPGGARHTALHINAEWLWLSGHRGLPSLHLRMGPTELAEWMDQVTAATTATDDLLWTAFSEWYGGFLLRAGERLPNATRAARLLALLQRYDHWDEEPEPDPDDAMDDWSSWDNW